MFSVTNQIQSYMDAMIADMKYDAPSNSGRLGDSIYYEFVEGNDGSFVIEIYMEDYGEFMEFGVNGTKKNNGSPFSFTNRKPPFDSVFDWVKSRNIMFRDARGRFITQRSTAFIIQNSIFEKGLEARPFIEPNLDKNLDGLANLTSEEITKAVLEEISKKLKAM